jgi:hypothetical protein
MWQLLIAHLQQAKTYGALLALPYVVLALWTYVEACLKISHNAVKTLNAGGVFSADFGLFIFTLPWSIVLDMQVPADWKPDHVHHGYKWAHFFNDQNHAINFALYVLFISLNAALLFLIGFLAFKTLSALFKT